MDTTINKQVKEWEKISATVKNNQELACKTYKELLQRNEKMVNHFLKRIKYMVRHFTKGKIRTSKKYKMRIITSMSLTGFQRKIKSLKHHSKNHQNGKKSLGSADENMETMKRRGHSGKQFSRS